MLSVMVIFAQGLLVSKFQLLETGSWSFQDWVPKLELGDQPNTLDFICGYPPNPRHLRSRQLLLRCSRLLFPTQF